MNSLTLARSAYGAPGDATRTPRETEYEVFARVTRHLRSAAAQGAAGFAALARAIHDNRTLWTTLAVDVADPGNTLPAALRARIFYLAQFTAEHSQKVLAGAAEVEPLVFINTAIMRGLRQEASAA
ncbi:flagellar biosynthesis regulator FlaF [Paracoccus sp. p3-h83]|uniref:flagellar biosynthesis regulator FlaF n=1 Tax=Paracoccus sp. p3-h83 TaxID=3342805 RepID=UPI0035BA24C2